MEFDLLYPDKNTENRRNKLKRLVQRPNSYFLDIKYDGELYHAYSHSQTPIVCEKSGEVIATPTGGKLRFKASCKMRRKND